jgi:hypothetical protein
MVCAQGSSAEAHGSPSARNVNVTPAIRLNANSSVAGSGITIKQMLHKAWHR